MTDHATAEGPETKPSTPEPQVPPSPQASSPDPQMPSPNSQMPPNTQMPEYKGAPLDAERGPGLGCFWTQVVLLAVLLVLTPLSVVWAWPSIVSAALLILSLAILFFVGMTIVFLLRLTAADRRSRRRPLAPTARPTVGDLENSSNKDDTGAQ